MDGEKKFEYSGENKDLICLISTTSKAPPQTDIVCPVTNVRRVVYGPRDTTLVSLKHQEPYGAIFLF